MIALKNGDVMQLLSNFIVDSTFLRFGTSVSVASLWLMAAERAAKWDNHEEEKNSISAKYVLSPRLFLIIFFFAKRSFDAMLSERTMSVSAAAVPFFSSRFVSVASLLFIHVVASVPPGVLLHVPLTVMKITLDFVFFTSADNVSSVLIVVFPLRLVSLSHASGRLNGFPLRFRSLPA